MLAAKRLSQFRFRELFGPDKGSDPFLHREIAWLASVDGAHIGSVILDLYDLDFGWVALLRDQAGCYQFDDCATSLPSAEAAEAALARYLEGRPLD